MPEGISLLPREVEQKKEQEQRGQQLRKGALIFLAASLLICIGIFIYSSILKSEASNLAQSIAAEETILASLSEMEITARDLEKRVQALQSILDDKIRFSGLLTSLARAVPADVFIVEMTIPSEEMLSVSGSSRSYSSLASFLLNLKDSRSPQVVFEAVELQSVSLDQQTGEARFDLNLRIVSGGLR